MGIYHDMYITKDSGFSIVLTTLERLYEFVQPLD